jgi:hypothetical protein
MLSNVSHPMEQTLIRHRGDLGRDLGGVVAGGEDAARLSSIRWRVGP